MAAAVNQPRHRKSTTHPLQAQLGEICLSWSTASQLCVTCLHLLRSPRSELSHFLSPQQCLCSLVPVGSLAHCVCSSASPLTPSFQPVHHLPHADGLDSGKSSFFFSTQELSKGILAGRQQTYKGSKKTMNKRQKKIAKESCF